jgi:hypothetical protein
VAKEEEEGEVPQLVVNAQKNHLHQNSNPSHLFGVVAFVSKILSERNNAGLIYVFLPSLIYKVHKASSAVTKPGHSFRIVTFLL